MAGGHNKVHDLATVPPNDVQAAALAIQYPAGISCIIAAAASLVGAASAPAALLNPHSHSHT